jgi:hypothetical protein
MRLNANWFILMSVSWLIAMRPVVSQDDTKDAAFGPFEAREVQCMRHADAIYVFTVKANSSEMPNQKDLRRLEVEAREAL